MRFKRIDVDTVRCIISEEELMENGLEVDDFLQNDGRTESFLRKIISMAEEEVGYKVQGGNITIQVAVLPEHTLALTFSEKPELGISNMLENLKSAVESLVKNAPDIEKLKQTSKELANQNHTDEGIAEIQISCGAYSIQETVYRWLYTKRPEFLSALLCKHGTCNFLCQGRPSGTADEEQSLLSDQRGCLLSFT